jgi:hypothetical protein
VRNRIENSKTESGCMALLLSEREMGTSILPALTVETSPLHSLIPRQPACVSLTPAALVSHRFDNNCTVFLGRKSVSFTLRTACVPSGETGDKVLLRRSAGHFLWSGLRARVAELRRFPICFRAMQPSFSAVQTVWRRERDSKRRCLLRTRNFLILRSA